MKTAICNELFEGWPPHKVFKYVSAIGYEGVEIAPFTISNDVRKITRKERREIKESATAHELTVVGTHWLLAKTTGLHLTHPDENVRRRTKQYFCELVKFTRDIGGKYMVLGSSKQRNVLEGVSFQQAWKYARQILLECSRFAEEYGAVIALEPLRREFTNFINTADEAMKFIREVSHPNLMLHLDVCSMVDEGKPIPEIIRKSKKYLVHFHANDDNGLGPGFGKVEYVPIIEALKEIKYDGFLSVEVFDFSLGPEKIATTSLENLKEILQKTAKT